MFWELMAQVATVASAVAVVGGFIVAYILFQKQANVDVFLEYTKRFHKVMSGFPQEAWEARFSQESLPGESKELRMVVLEYLNLCSEEYYLYKHRLLDGQVWCIWEREIKRTLASPLFLREWAKLEPEFRSFPVFCGYVDEIQGRPVPARKDVNWIRRVLAARPRPTWRGRG